MPHTILYAEPLWTEHDFERRIFGDAADVHRLHVGELADIDADIRGRVDGLMLFRHFMPAAAFDLFPRLRTIVRLGVGYDRIDRSEAARRGIVVCNVPDYATAEVADHAIALALGLSRGVFLHLDLQRGSDPAPWAPKDAPVLKRMSATTFGVVGLGRIGTSVALKAKALGCDVVFYDPQVANGQEIALGLRRARSLAELLPQCGIVSLHVPLTRETRWLIGEREIGKLPPNAIIINTARGPVLDLDAAGRALRSGRLAALGLDVIPQEPPKEPLPELIAAYRAREPWVIGRLVITPHVAFCSPEAAVDLHRKAVETMHASLVLGHPQNVIDPHQEWGAMSIIREGAKRAKPSGVIAAISTPVRGMEPDVGRLLSLASYLLENGCDGLNLLGTTGEATSFSLGQRIRVMEAVAKAGLPLGRFMVGTGAAALADAVELSRRAADLGFGGALVLPPFYYKPVPADGVRTYLGAIVEATTEWGLPIYLYNFPALSGVKYEIELIRRLVQDFGERIGGLKDSSGDMPYAREAADIASHFDVFPSNEATLGEARGGRFPGCISATANLNASYCHRALHESDDGALATAVKIRELFNGKPLVPGIKALLSKVHDDPALAQPMPPLCAWSAEMTSDVFQAYHAIIRQ